MFYKKVDEDPPKKTVATTKKQAEAASPSKKILQTSPANADNDKSPSWKNHMKK